MRRCSNVLTLSKCRPFFARQIVPSKALGVGARSNVAITKSKSCRQTRSCHVITSRCTDAPPSQYTKETPSSQQSITQFLRERGRWIAPPKQGSEPNRDATGQVESRGKVPRLDTILADVETACLAAAAVAAADVAVAPSFVGHAASASVAFVEPDAAVRLPPCWD